MEASTIPIETTDITSTSSSSSSSWSSNPYTPVYLSCLAGASTCLGAAVVFLHPQTKTTSTTSTSTSTISTRTVSESTMSFALALAGSVMITVSVVSIGSECLQKDNDDDDDGGGGWIEFGSKVFWERILSFGIGCCVYLGLSKFVFPEPPEELLLLDLGMIGNGSSLENSKSSGVGEEEKDGKEGGDGCDLEDGGGEARGSSSSSNNNNDRNATVPSRRNTRSVSRHNSTSSSSSSSSSNETPFIRGSNHNHNNNVNTPSSSSLSTKSKSFLAWTKGNDLQTTHQRRAWRLAMLLFLSLLLHNFPEGLAVAASALESPKLGLTVTIGIMIHNIPEGIAIAIPCLAARPQSPWLSFVLASASGLAEPMGAFLALLFLSDLKEEEKGGGGGGLSSLENVLSFVAGIMITVALWELFPEAYKHSSSSSRVGTVTSSGGGISSSDDDEKELKQQQKKNLRPFWFGTVLGVVIMLLTEFYTP